MNNLLEQLEALRKKVKIATGISIIMLAIGFVSFMFFVPLGFLLFGAGIVCLIFWVGKTSKAYAKLYKENLVKSALEDVFTDVSFVPEMGVSRETVKSTGMMHTGDRFSSNDFIVASYKGIPFSQSDLHIEVENTDSEGHRSYSTLFRGRWITFEFNKEFTCDLQVVSKGFSGKKRKGGLFASKENKLHKIELENEEFNKLFTVYAQNQQEAFYILTPHIMDALIKLYHQSGYPLMLMFVNGNFHIASYTKKDAFEPSVWKSLDIESERQKIIKDITVITDFADALRLENTIYKK